MGGYFLMRFNASTAGSLKKVEQRKTKTFVQSTDHFDETMMRKSAFAFVHAIL